jgi:hypothetical protein
MRTSPAASARVDQELIKKLVDSLVDRVIFAGHANQFINQPPQRLDVKLDVLC